MNLNNVEAVLENLEHKITTMTSKNFIGNQYDRKNWILFFEDFKTYKSVLAKYLDEPKFHFLPYTSSDTQLRVATITNDTPIAIVTYSGEKNNTFNVYRNKSRGLILIRQNISSFEVFSILEAM